MVFLIVLIAVLIYSVDTLYRSYLIKNNFKAETIIAVEYTGAFLFTAIFFTYPILTFEYNLNTVLLLLVNPIIWGFFSYFNLKSYEHVSASEVEILESTKYIVIILASIFIFAEKITATTLIGIAVILLPLFYAYISKKLAFNKGTAFAIIAATLLGAGISYDKYLAADIPISIILISIYIVPTAYFLIRNKDFKLNYLKTPIKKNPKLLLIPLMVFAADGLFIYAFAIGGDLISVAVLSECGVIFLLLIEYFILSIKRSFGQKVLLSCINLLGVALIII